MSDIVVKDVPVNVKLEKTIVIENLDHPGPKFLQKGKVQIIVALIPIILAVVYFIIAFASGLFNPVGGTAEDEAERSAAQTEFVFWIPFIVISFYCLMIVRNQIFKSMREAYRITKITKEEHQKLMKLVFGPIALVVILAIAVVVCIYDFNAFGLTVPNLYDGEAEGWLLNSEWPTVYVPFYVDQLMAVDWLLIWWTADLLSVAYFWYAISFLIYSKKITKKFTFRNEPSIVKQLNLTDLEEKAFISVSYGFIPFLSLKSLSQMALVTPWYSDTILTGITVVMFVLLLMIPARNVKADIKKETMGDEFDAKAKSILALLELIEKVDKGEDLSLKKAVMALLYASYLDQIKSFKASSSGNQKKIITALAGPAATYGLKAAGPLLK